MSKSRRGFTASLELPSRSSSASPVRPSKLLDQQTTKTIKTKVSPCDGKHSPMEQNVLGLSSSSVTEDPPADTAKKPEKKKEDEKILKLKDELARLQEQETVLSHLLSLEKEQRVRAEQLVEQERLACLGWRHRLAERCGEEREEVDCAEEDVTEERSQDARPEECNVTGGSDLLGGLDEDEFNFSTSVFGKLTSDLQQILKVGFNTDHTSQSSLSRALAAVKTNDPSTLTRCLPSLLPEDGLPLLKLAAERGHVGCVRLLLAENKFESFQASGRKEETTPLHLAAKNARKRSLQALLEHHVPLDSTDYNGHTPLFLALQAGHAHCAEALIKAGASLDIISNSGRTLLHAAVIGQLPHVLRTLIVRLNMAAEGSKFEEVLNKKDEDLRMAIHIAASKGYEKCTEVLCACSELDVSQRDRWNRTPLDMAINDTRDILLNKESKSVVLYVSMSPHLLPHSTWARSCEPPAEGEELQLAVATVSVLRYHRLSDVEPLVSNALQQYCGYLDTVVRNSNLTSAPPVDESGCGGFADAHLELAERVGRRYGLAKKFIGSIPDLESESGMENGNDIDGMENQNENATDGTENGNGTETLDKASYMEHCKRVLMNAHSQLVTMDTSGSGVARYTVGEHKWEAGQLPRRLGPKNLFSLFEDTEEEKEQAIYVTLKGASDGCLNEFSLKLMIPTAQLTDYVNLLKGEKMLMIHGPQGSGKSHLARTLADVMKNMCGPSHTQVIHTSFHRSFERGDIFRLLHLNGLLLPVTEKGASSLPGTEYKSHVLVIDDLSLLPHPSLLAELISILEYRGAEHSLWVNMVLGSDGTTVLYPGGLYYMKEQCYVIATWTTGCGNVLPAVATDRFPHVAMDATSRPTCGVLRRHLMAAHIHHTKGVWPHVTTPLYRLIRWVGDVWMLYGRFMEDLDMSPMATGLRHFLSCPVNSACPEQDIPQWLDSIWQHHLVPSVEFCLQETLSNQPSSGQQQENAQQMGTQLLQALVGLVLLPTCPLSSDERDHLLQQLLKNLDGFFFTPSINNSGGPNNNIPAVRHSHSPTKPVPILHPSFAPLSLSVRNPAGSPLLNKRRGSLQCLNSLPTGRRGLGVLNKGTPRLTERRGSLCDLRLRSEKKGVENIVSFEDMINMRKKNSSTVEKSDSSQMSLLTIPTVNIKTSEDEEEEREGEGQEGEEEKAAGKKGRGNKTLRKIRSKTISLFSKDGTGTLPRLFRRNSRVSLVSVSEEEAKLPFISSPQLCSTTNSDIDGGSLISAGEQAKKPEFTRSLGDMNTTTATTKTRTPSSAGEEQQSTPSDEDEHRDVVNALDDLDDFLDLLTTSTASDRINNQRSPLPNNVAAENEKKQQRRMRKAATVPKYYISTTGSAQGRLGLREMSPPAYSMPDLTVESVEEVEEDSGSDSSTDVSPASQHHCATEQRGGYHHRKSNSYDQTTYNSTRSRVAESFHEKSQSYDQSHEPWVESSLGTSEEEGRGGNDTSVGPLDPSADGYWHVTSPPGSGGPGRSSYLSPNAVSSPVRRHKSDCTGIRPTSPLAMSSYTSVGPQDSPDQSSPAKTPGVKFFNYHPQQLTDYPAKRNGLETTPTSNTRQHSQTPRSNQREGNTKSPDRPERRSRGQRLSGHGVSPTRNLTRGRYVNQDAGKDYRARSNSIRNVDRQKRDLTTSYDGCDKSKARGNSARGWKNIGSDSSPPTTSAAMFSASLGGSRDNFKDEAEEML